MHKIFAKPTFLGKKVIYLPTCHSTNEELQARSKVEQLPEGTVVYAGHQTGGKGQRGNKWQDEPGQNVLFSLLLRPSGLSVRKQHFLNLITGLAVIMVLKDHLDQKFLKLKWPNDLYFQSRKMGGVLIENTVKAQKIESTIIGVGLNLNQVQNLPENATSMSLESRVTYDLDLVIGDVLSAVEFWYLRLRRSKYDQIIAAYHKALYWKDEPHIFKNREKYFSGVIRGIDSFGRLIVAIDEEQFTFEIKEIQFID
ncbi:MAG: biotin--[acetyl-CoA-carboxylase] ligase [Bacteroidota bacterium]